MRKGCSRGVDPGCWGSQTQEALSATCSTGRLQSSRIAGLSMPNILQHLDLAVQDVAGMRPCIGPTTLLGDCLDLYAKVLAKPEHVVSPT
jgi:hypothetical protein